MDGVNDGNDGRKCGYGQERGPCSRAQEPRHLRRFAADFTQPMFARAGAADITNGRRRTPHAIFRAGTGRHG